MGFLIKNNTILDEILFLKHQFLGDFFESLGSESLKPKDWYNKNSKTSICPSLKGKKTTI